jgi:translation initiation factor 2 subunit 2
VRRPSRKSVAFTEEKLVVDPDGSTKMVASSNDDAKDTAMSHTSRTPPLTAALEAFTDAPEAPAAENGGDELDMLPLKKKKKAKPVEDAAEDGAASGDDGAEPVLDLTMKKKKKKKVVEGEEDSFAAKIAALDLEKEEGAAAAPAEKEDTDGDMNEGTGIWQHDENKVIAYNPLLKRVSRAPSCWSWWVPGCRDKTDSQPC